jgi:CotH kinase protein/Secretion system C-terminal sorting domain
MKKIYLPVFFLLLGITLSAQTLTSSNLPIIVINTNGQTIVDEPKIMADMGIIFNGSARNNITDPYNHYNGKVGIEIRGQSSQQFPMKSYSIELWNSAGASVDQALFGLPKESDWVLYAPYTDKTLMRNFLAYTMSREMGHWAANTRFVELVVNGDYKGIYVFMEKIKRNSGRVNISKINTTDISGDALTGGYIFAIDKEPDAWYSSYRPADATRNQRIQFSFTTPKLTAIVPAQAAYIKSYIDSFENTLASAQFKEGATGWRKFADEQSFIDYFIVNEVSRNVDGYRLSTYMYKDRQSKGGKIIAGPVWDYDLAFRNANYCAGSNTDGWAVDFNKTCPQDFWQIPFWWQRFMEDENYRSKLRCRWKELRQNSLNLARVNFLIDSVVNLTAEARQRHFTRWPVLGQYIWPNPQPIATTYNDEINFLKTWLNDRLTWIDNHIPNDGLCYDYPKNVKESVMIQGMPNPVKNNYQLEIRSRIAQAIFINVTDFSGRLVYNETKNIEAGYNRFSINMGSWSPGIYMLQLTAASGEKLTEKLLKD